ncbi:unnamed protein product, partial [Notodromas monacha]
MSVGCVGISGGVSMPFCVAAEWQEVEENHECQTEYAETPVSDGTIEENFEEELGALHSIAFTEDGKVVPRSSLQNA